MTRLLRANYWAFYWRIERATSFAWTSITALYLPRQWFIVTRTFLPRNCFFIGLIDRRILLGKREIRSLLLSPHRTSRSDPVSSSSLNCYGCHDVNAERCSEVLTLWSCLLKLYQNSFFVQQCFISLRLTITYSFLSLIARIYGNFFMGRFHCEVIEAVCNCLNILVES